MASSLLAIEPEPRPVHLQAQPTSDIGKLFSNAGFGKANLSEEQLCMG